MARSNKVSTKSHASTSRSASVPARVPAQVRAVVLAAGGSRRMGQPKALLRLGDRTVIARQVAALAQVADRVVVVLGAPLDGVDAELPAEVIRAYNPDWATTSPIDSAVFGLRAVGALGDAGAVLVFVTPVDVVPPRLATLEALLAAGRTAVPVGPDGRRGHPVLLDAATVRQVCAAPPPTGLRGALTAAFDVPVEDPWVAVDFDDPAAFAAVAAETASRWA